MGVRGDMRLYQRAIRQRWVTDDIKADVMEAVRRGLTCGDPRAEQTAVKSALMMEEQNQRDEHKVIDVHVTTRHDELAGIAADLGIEESVIEAIQRAADLGTAGIEQDGGGEATEN